MVSFTDRFVSVYPYSLVLNVKPVVITTFLHNLTCLGLATALLMGSVVPPGHLHSHVGGHVAHHHGPCQHGIQVCNHDEHGHDHRHHHAPRRVAKVQTVGCTHVHFDLWLFDWTAPVRDDSDSDAEELFDAVYLVRLIGNCLPATSDWQFTASHVTPTTVQVGPAVISVWDTERAFLANLLCDAARFERSGVQLF